MAIPNFDRETFVQGLNAALSPSRPIDSIEHLCGRDDEYQEIEKALSMEGRHVFIYGDRGVGKSSLAATLATSLQSSDNNPIAVSGSPDETFSTIVRNILIEATGGAQLKRTQTTDGTKVGLEYLGGNRSTTTEQVDFSKAEFTIADAVAALRATASVHSKDTVVVIDEFDRIAERAERNKFADLLKHLGDARVPIRFIFTGVGSSLDELLGAHPSAIRQLHTKELSRLSYDGRWDIAIQAAAAFCIEVPRSIYIRIAAISDGFPYYVHLMMEKILWRAFDEPEDVTSISWDLFHHGLRDAIGSINAELKKPYEVVLRQKTQDYEPVLWATADGEDLYRPGWQYQWSYLRVMKQLDREPLNNTQFRYRIKKLMSKSLGPVLKRDPLLPECYMYNENMLRGFVRMQAEAHGVDLYGEEVEVKRQHMHVPSRVSVGYRGPTIPGGVRFKGERPKKR